MSKELNYDLPPIERLEGEIKDEDDENAKLVGQLLIEEMSADENLAKAYKDRKVTLAATMAYIKGEAKKLAKNGCAMITGKKVLGLAIHFVQDGDVPNGDASSNEKEAEEKVDWKKLHEEVKKEKESRRKPAKKAEKKESGGFMQMSLFEGME